MMLKNLTPIRQSVPLSNWPEEDQSRWCALFEDRDIFDRRGPKPRMNSVTRGRREDGYGRWLNFLSIRFPDRMEMLPDRRVAQDALRGWYESLEGLSSSTYWTYFDSLLAVLRLICPDRDWSELGEIVNRLRANVELLRTPEDKARDSAWLYQAGIDYMELAENKPEHRALMGSSAFRDGLMVSFLASRPFRRRTFSELTLSRHVQETSDGYVITVFEDNLKYGKGFSVPLPVSLVPYFDRYLRFHRPRLLQKNDCDALWVTRAGAALTYGGLGNRFERMTEKVLGERMTMHAFRHSAATSLLEWDPEAAALLAPLLGHNSEEITDRYYVARNRARKLTAYQSVLADLRKRNSRRRRA